MAGDVIIRVDAETQGAVNAYLKLVDAQSKVDAGAKRNKQNLTEVEKYARGVSGAFVNLFKIDPATLVNGLMDVAKYLNQIGKDARQFNEELLKSIASAQRLKDTPAIQSGIKSFNAPLANMTDRKAAFDAVAGRTPSASTEQQLRIAEQAARFTGAFMNPGEAGAVMGEIAKLSPDKSMDDMSDLAMAVMKASGKYGGKLDESGFKSIGLLTQSGAMTTEEALGLALGSLETRVGPEVLNSLQQKLTEQRDPVAAKRGQRLSEKDLAENAFYAASPAERYAMLRGNKGVRQEILGGQSGAFDVLMGSDPQRRARELMAAQSGNLFEGELSEAMTNPQIQEHLRRRAAAVRADLAQQGFGEQAGEAGEQASLAWAATMDVAGEEAKEAGEKGVGAYYAQNVVESGFGPVALYKLITTLSRLNDAYERHAAALESDTAAIGARNVNAHTE
ncbi:MAG: hypothetical protein AMXMBFR7_25480 [Planctomycetota bacterium]